MKKRRILSCLALLLAIAVLLSSCGSGTSSTAGSDPEPEPGTDDTAFEPDADRETDTDKDEKISSEGPNDEQPIAEIAEWQTAVGDWEDENGLGYTMSVFQNEADVLVSISYIPHGGVTLEWTLPCKLVPDNGTLHYDQGIMTYTEAITADSSVETNQIGGFSLSSDQNILCWYNGPEEDADPINFVRTQSKVDSLASEYMTDEYLAQALNDPEFNMDDPNCVYDPVDDAQKSDEELSNYEFEQKYGYFFWVHIGLRKRTCFQLRSRMNLL